MLLVRRSLPPVRLRRRRRHHERGRRPPVLDLAAGLTRRVRNARRAAAATVFCLVVAGAVLGTAPAAGAGPGPARQRGQQPPPPVSYAPPVDAPIADPFRPPAGPYAPGNRGLEYATAPGTQVRASADGTVTFAGQAGGALHVTLLHADGVRTSYSFLAAVEVALGRQVRQGDRIGTTAARLHFGARAGDAYFDPSALFTGAVTQVELLPFEVPPGSTPDAEARALVALTFAEGRGLPLPGLDDTLGWLRDRARSGATYAQQLSPVGRGLSMATDLADRLLLAGPCSAGPPPSRPVDGQQHRVALTVAGLGSSSTSGSIDELRIDDLGYDRDRVVRFSYAGGRTASTGAAFGGVGATDYASADTQGDLVAAGARLADLVEQVVGADPEAVVDVYAHSLGGIVTRLALADLHHRGFDLGRLGVVTTIGSPHGGADAATAVAGANTRLTPNLALDAAEGVLGTGLDPDAVAVGQLAEHSAVVAGLAAHGVPAGVRLVSIAGRGDLVVAAPHTEVAGATNVTVPVAGRSAHGDLVGSDAATGEMARSLAGQPPGCESWGDAVADVVAGHTISAAEDHIGAVVSTAGG